MRQIHREPAGAAADRADSGHIRFEGRDLLAFDASELRAFRRDAQIIFQDPMPRSIRA
jgi:ABC-type microcin C transport system duplicated ATPase subunit YejF